MTLGEFLEYLYEKYVLLREFIIQWLCNLWYGKESESDVEDYSSDDEGDNRRANYGTLNSRINARDMARIIREFPLDEVRVDNADSNLTLNTAIEISYAESFDGSVNGSDDTMPLIGEVLSPVTMASDTDEIESSFELINHE